MSEPLPVEPPQFFEFIGGSELSVLLVSVHPSHTFNRVLGQQLTADHPNIALGTVGLSDLLLSGTPAVSFLHRGLRACGAPSRFGALPGYCLFRRQDMLAWDAGLPTMDDIGALARSALIGAICSGFTNDVAFVGKALQMATEQLAAYRVTVHFRQAVASGTTHRPHAAESAPPRPSELDWAYRLLGVLPTATDREVHDAWKQRRLEVHPDLAAGDPLEFDRRSRLSVEINRAREVIMSSRRTH